MTLRDSAHAPHTLPRGRYAASREVVWSSQRERLLEGMADAVAEKGYARVAVADVIERARVSRRSFYEHFDNKEECFLAAYDAGVARLLTAIDESVRAVAPDWLRGAVEGTRCYLEMLAANPAFARTYLIEIFAAGRAALERRRDVHRRFAGQLLVVHRLARPALPELPEPSEHALLACVGAINELVTDHMIDRGAESLPELAGPILEVELALLAGGELTDRVGSSRA
jgi:AcrR family transcriptional regulator